MKNGLMLLRMFVHRYLWVYPAMVVYLGLMGVFAHFSHGSMDGVLEFTLCLPFFVGMIATSAAFANPESDLASEATGYPPFLLRMPFKTTALALWPIAAGALWSAGCWVGIAELYFLPLKASVEIVPPAVAISAIVMCMQALLWMPVRSGKVRIGIGIAIPGAMMVGTIWMVNAGWSSRAISLAYGAEATVAGLVAIYGLVRARTVGSVSRRINDSVTPDRPRRAKKAFKSAYEAQVWLEWQRQGRVLPILTTVTFVLLSLPLLWNSDAYPIWYEGVQVYANTWVWSMLPMLPWIPLLFATIIGLGARRSDLRTDEGAFHLFFATRPLDNASMLRAKYAAITRGVLISWGITLATGLLWLSMTASNGFSEHPLIYYLVTLAQTRSLIFDGSLLLVVVAWTWRNQVVGAFVDFLPNKWSGRVYPLAVVLSGAFMAIVFAFEGREIQRSDTVALFVIPMAMLVAAKFWVAIKISQDLIEQQPSEESFVSRTKVLWPRYAAVVGLSIWWLVSFFAKGLEQKPAVFSAPVIVLFALLITPLVRPLAARWALETGRHR